MALMSWKFRALVETTLYSEITVPRKRWIWSRQYLWPLLRILSKRPDLAWKVKRILTTVREESMQVSLPYTNIFGVGSPFTDHCEAELPEATVLGALLQLVINVEKTELSYFKYCHGDDDNDNPYPPPLQTDCMSTLFPGFDGETAHLKALEGLQKIRHLYWQASLFHWVLAISPNLKHHLEPVCEIIADNAPHEVNTRLLTLHLSIHSSILIVSSEASKRLKPFLAHIPAIKHVTLCVDDNSYKEHVHEWWGTSVQIELSGLFSALVEHLGLLRSSFVELKIHPGNVQFLRLV